MPGIERGDPEHGLGQLLRIDHMPSLAEAPPSTVPGLAPEDPFSLSTSS